MIKQEINFYPDIEYKKDIPAVYSGIKKITQPELEILLKKAKELGYTLGTILFNKYIPTRRIEIVNIAQTVTDFYYINNEPGFIKCKNVIDSNIKYPKDPAYGYSLSELQDSYTIEDSIIDVTLEDVYYDPVNC